MESMPGTHEFSAAGPNGPAARRRLRRFLSDRRAASIVEFALVTPILLALLGAAVNFGMLVRTKMLLSASVSAAASYAISSTDSASWLSGSTDGTALASTLATIMSSANGTNWAQSTVVLNNGPTSNVAPNTQGAYVTTPGGTTANAIKYYCPTGSGGSIAWGTGTSVSQACTGSSTLYGGKYVVLTATRNFTPLINFPSLDYLPINLSFPTSISATSVVQVQ